MKCVFVFSRHEFSVQFHSPAVVEHHCENWELCNTDVRQAFSVFWDGTPTYVTGAVAVFIPTRLGKRERRELYRTFCAENPRVLAAACATS